MNYFKINDVDFSTYVNKLEVSKVAHYNAQTNAAGNTVVDFINHKRTISVGIIPLSNEDIIPLLNAIAQFNVKVSFRDPHTGVLAEDVDCIIPSEAISYYTIQANNVRFNAFTLTFTEL